MMEITIGGLIFGLILLAVPALAVYRFQLGVAHQLSVALLKSVAYVVLMGVFVKYLVVWNSIGLNILWVLLVAVPASATVITKARLHVRVFLVPVLTGVLTATLVVGIYFAVLVMGQRNPFAARFFLPICGLLFGAMLEVDAKALNMYYMGLRHHNRLYEYLLGNGATHAEAVNYFLRRALQKAVVPGLSKMGYMVVGSAPVMMWVLVMGGVDVMTAVELEVLVHVAALAGVVISVVVSLLVAHRYAFDGYGRLKEIEPKTSQHSE